MAEHPTEDDLRYIRRFPDKCCAEVSRGGELQPCDKPAVAVTVDVEDEHWWPVCPYHCRGRVMVPLAELLAVVTVDAAENVRAIAASLRG